MNTQSFGTEELEHLNEVTSVTLPGNRFALIALTALATVTLLSCCISTLLADRHAQPVQKPSNITSSSSKSNILPNQPPQSGDGGSPILSALVCMIPVMAIIGFVLICVFRIKFNNDYILENTINLKYNRNVAVFYRYLKLSKLFEKLDNEGDLLKIATIDGEYRHCGKAHFRSCLPKFLTCNAEVYCISDGLDCYYFLPDCVLIYQDRTFYRTVGEKFFLSTNRVSGRFYIERSRSVMVHGRIRKDGGNDQRFNTRYGSEKYDSSESLGPYGSIVIKVFDERITLLSVDRTLTSDLEIAYRDWKDKADLLPPN